jgi:hypothetical protein
MARRQIEYPTPVSWWNIETLLPIAHNIFFEMAAPVVQLDGEASQNRKDELL